MLDAILIENCADPSLAPALVERFVSVAGSEDPLAVSVTANGRFLLVPKPTTSPELLAILRQWVGKASVRVGLTQFPAGVGIKDIAELDPKMAEPCGNLRAGTALFSRVARIVTRSYGDPTDGKLLDQMFDDAVQAWRTGVFEGERVFSAPDPGGATFFQDPVTGDDKQTDADADDETRNSSRPTDGENIGSAGMRIDLSRIGGE
jgi:hypothetical protein